MNQQSILLLLAWEILCFHVAQVVSYRIAHYVVQVGVLAQEAWFKTFVQPYHIMYYQHLPIAMLPRANADSWYFQARGNFFSQCGGYLLQHYGKATQLFQLRGIFL